MNSTPTDHAFGLLERYWISDFSQSLSLIQTLPKIHENEHDDKHEPKRIKTITESSRMWEAVEKFLCFGEMLSLAVQSGHAAEEILYYGLAYSLRDTWEIVKPFAIGRRKEENREAYAFELASLIERWEDLQPLNDELAKKIGTFPNRFAEFLKQIQK